MKNFWQQLPKPFFVQAPLDDVSDTVFRQILAKAGRPDVFFTEFTNTDGLLSKGSEKVMRRLQHTAIERPLIAQIWGNNPDHYTKSAQLIQQMGFDGIDINMGCPDRKIVKRGSCSGLIKNHALAKELIAATKEGAGSLPVSVKTRLGYNAFVTQEWVSFLLEQDIDALTLHGRIATQMSKYPANWDEIGKAVQLRNQMKSKTVIIGNGDVLSYQDGVEKHQQYGVDGIMIGRGIFHNLWIFNKDINPDKIPLKEKLQLLVENITLFQKTWGNTKDINTLKKFYKVYVHGIPDAGELRMQLMEQPTPEETIAFIRKKIQQLP